MERLSKQVSAEMNIRNNRGLYFLFGPCPWVIKRTEKIVASLPGYELGSRGIRIVMAVEDDGKKGIRL
jgi:hypothetical protein